MKSMFYSLTIKFVLGNFSKLFTMLCIIFGTSKILLSISKNHYWQEGKICFILLLSKLN